MILVLNHLKIFQYKNDCKMKQLYVLGLAALLLTGCSGNSSGQGEAEKNTQSDQKAKVHFGEKITAEGALSVEDMIDEMGDQKRLSAKVKGKVTAVCQKKGCWMKIQRTGGENMRVTFKDYSFFVPKDIAGKEVVFKGKAYYDTVDVETLRHFARDAGKSEEEVAAITEPEHQLAFKAEGVRLLEE